jgi:hypothetical protein
MLVRGSLGAGYRTTAGNIPSHSTDAKNLKVVAYVNFASDLGQLQPAVVNLCRSKKCQSLSFNLGEIYPARLLGRSAQQLPIFLSIVVVRILMRSAQQ